MERFDGLFIGTTNAVDRLDRAALRRFAVKIRFDHLRPRQARALVAAALRGLGIEGEEHDALASVERMRNLAPGDVAAVVRSFRLLGRKPDARDFVAALADELTLKSEGTTHSIGF